MTQDVEDEIRNTARRISAQRAHVRALAVDARLETLLALRQAGRPIEVAVAEVDRAFTALPYRRACG